MAATDPALEDASPPATPIAARPTTSVRFWEIGLVLALALALYLPKLGSYNLWDPWETHYGEVARRMLEDHDWIRMRWQNEDFRSKPVLTFWLMGAGMKLSGVGHDGGYSGEFVASHRPEWALRLPFVLFGVAGLVALFMLVARFASRRAAWLAVLVCATSPYYSLISRQAITDMPSCALLVAAMACFAFVLGDEDPAQSPRSAALARHAFLFTFALAVLPQIVGFALNLRGASFRLGRGIAFPAPWAMLPFAAAFAAAFAWAWKRVRTVRQVTLCWFYFLNGVAVLAKGPVSPALAGLTILCTLALTNGWSLLASFEIPLGLLIGAAVCLPWHFAIYAKDGPAWLQEYVNQHLLNRAFVGVHGDRGTFDYFLGQLGIGMWPWVALLPAALGALVFFGAPRTGRERVRLFLGIWAIVGFFFFSVIQTKFHHYLLPVVPAFAAVVALWLDDLLAAKVRLSAASIWAALALLAVTSVDLVKGQWRLVHLFIYRYDRPWPSGPPWNVDFTRTLLVFALLLSGAVVGLLLTRARRAALVGLAAGAIAFTVFALDDLMVKAAPHWGQRALHEVYYRKRHIAGVVLTYDGLREVATDWADGRDLEIQALLPETLHIGDPMRVRYEARGDKGEMHGRVARLGERRFWITVPPEERSRIAPLVARAQTPSARSGRRWVSIDADRLIAWQLNWRGENFYSGGEIYNPRDEDGQTVFIDTDNKKFLDYLGAPARTGKGRKFWIITEKGRLDGLRGILPTQQAKDTFRVEDDSSNKFGLGSFVLD